MKNELQQLGEMIIRRKHEIADLVHSDRMAGVIMTEDQKNAFQQIEPRILELRAEFITLFGEALIDYDDQNKSFEKVRQWGKDTGEYLFNLGAPLDEALKDTSFYRESIWKAIKEEATIKGLSAACIFEVIEIIDPLLDHAVYSFSLNYVQAHQKVLEQTKSAFLELSVPVVPLMKGTGILPLIGNIDTERAKLLMEETMDQVVKLQLEHLIIDISGVMFVDTMVADQLFRVIDALSLLGVSAILTGIRPEVAQTMVTLGLNLDKINVKGNLHQAFSELQTK
jgi:rsbT co-antagonist protein RsbR